ncbi:MAG: alpha-glucan family phosphorylase [Rhodothermia bacterium]|nr:MAG: alpha-glucan family phosphorylase [Rhodothermia bacterium]
MGIRKKLEHLASNLWWSWNPEALDLFRRLNPSVFEVSNGNPRVALRRALSSVVDDPRFQTDVDEIYSEFISYMEAGTNSEPSIRTAYFCMEFGLHESLPLYSGGLGILAGDHLKASSDAGLDLTGVGLLLRHGYFKQYFDDTLLQQAEHPSIDVTKQPLEPVRNEAGEPLLVSVFCGKDEVFLRAWRLKVGRIELLLLDSDINRNLHENRFLTSRLYQGRTHIRLKQEIVLGIGGVRFLKAIGKDIDVYHMNEGHCAFLTLELLSDAGWEAGEDSVRSQCVFTTHTPVLAGHDRFESKLVVSELDNLRQKLGCTKRELLSFGRVNPDSDDELFTMTILALKLSRSANGVSKLNGHVAREQWHPVYADKSVDEVPIGHVTNGVHLSTWASIHARPFLRNQFGEWENPDLSVNGWSGIRETSDSELWEYRRMLRTKLIEFVEDRVGHQSFDQAVDLSPDALTIGFARRFASYKRAPLLFSDLDRAARLFSNTDLPVQIIFAGKAHPDNDEGRYDIKEILDITRQSEFSGKVIFLENYNMGIGRMLVSGSDVWLNNPRRPHEACGTSGQKVTIHGGLNLSVQDGWWAEAYDGSNGFAIGNQDQANDMDTTAGDIRDAEFLYSTLEEQILPMFYERNDAGIPEEWLGRIRNAMQELTFEYSARRMIRDYIDKIYCEAETTEMA